MLREREKIETADEYQKRSKMMEDAQKKSLKGKIRGWRSKWEKTEARNAWERNIPWKRMREEKIFKGSEFTRKIN